MCFIFAEGVAAAVREKAFPVLYLFAAVFAGVVIPALFSTLVKLRQLENGRLYVLIPFIVAFITDAGAYFVGITFGKRHIFPNVSPKKSLEGCIGGIATVIAASALYGVILKFAAGLSPDFFALCLYGLLGGVVTELGDLAFSLIKREFGVKDYGNLLPGHGGILDRFDSMIFAAPVLYLLAVLWPAF
jgi:phosphatidate cytidylyltransferase